MRYVLFLLLLINCQEDSALKSVCADPIGSEDVTMVNNTLFCFIQAFTTIEHPGCFKTEFTPTTQIFKAENYTGKLVGMIVDVGVVTCLGEVKIKPAIGYVYAVDAVLKHGYVVKFSDNTYGRFFLDSWVKSSTGAVSKIYVTWQYAF